MTYRRPVFGDILRTYDYIEGKRTRVWQVYIDDYRVGTWTKRRWARRDLRDRLRNARKRH